MKLSEIIKKYEPLGWKFRYTTTSIDNFWTFQSPRMSDDRGFIDTFFDEKDAESVEVNEEKMLEYESKCYIFMTYGKQIEKSLDFVSRDIHRQLELLDKQKIPIPETLDVKFTIKLK